MSEYKPQVEYICSIYPGKLPVITRHYGPSLEAQGPNAVRRTNFELLPVPRGEKPFVLRVYDSFQTVLDIRTGKQTGTTPVPVEEICDDLLDKWVGNLFNVPAGAKPGVMKIANTSPSSDELRQMESQQALYMAHFFSEGERLHREAHSDQITDMMRLSAEYLGEKRIWSDPAIARDSAPCPLCTTMVPNLAFICPACQHVIREIPAELIKFQSQLTQKTA